MKLKHISNIKWIGGKHGKEEKYLDLMPDHKIFVDCFFGSGAVPFYKETVNPSKITIVNDINDELINYMLVLRDRKEELYEKVTMLPFSESLFKKYQYEPKVKDELERAARFYYVMRLGFGGGGHKYKNGIGISKTIDRAGQYYNICEHMHDMAKLIKRWHILCTDFEECINKSDSKETLFFIDPPYFGREDLYSGGFKKEDHIRLKSKLEKIKGKAMVCYYEDEYIENLYKDWKVIKYKSVNQINNRKFGEKMKEVTEMILLNYEPHAEQLKLI